MKAFIRKRLGDLLIPKNKLLVFTLHQSTPIFNQQVNGTYIWSSTELFREQLKYLIDNFPILPLYDAMVSLRSGKLKGTAVAITFDDGDASVANYIAPMLQKLNVPATFFINTAYFPGNKKGYWFNIYNYLKFGTEVQRSLLSDELISVVESLRNTKDQEYYRRHCFRFEDFAEAIEPDVNFYMTMDDVKNLDPKLFTVALHGHEHQRFSMMTKDWQKMNLVKNIEILSAFSSYKPIFAIPFGKPIDWNSDTLDLCKELKLEVAFSNGGINTTKSFGIERLPVDGFDLKNVVSSIGVKKLEGLKLFKRL
jgi:peptidoglycan/xylan/chitin deacetylase (PgdA/CDA1 family)